MLDSDFLLEIDATYSDIVISRTDFYQVGIFRVKICFHGAADTEIFTKAISHLKVENSSITHFTIHVSDKTVKLPRPTWNWNDTTQRGEIPTYDPALVDARFMDWQNTFYLVNHSKNQAFFWTKTISDLPEWERSFPFRDILHAWFRKEKRFFILHAAAVGTEKGGVILTGKSGSGKSTSALACFGSELKYAGDDMVLVDIQDKMIYSLYNVAKLNFDQIERFPHLKKHIFNENSEAETKAQIFVNDFLPDQLVLKMPLVALIVPVFNSNVHSKWSVTTVAKGTLALSPSTIALLNESHEYFHKLRLVAESVNNYQLETGTDLDTIPKAIQEIITCEITKRAQ